MERAWRISRPFHSSERKYTAVITETTGIITLIPENIPASLTERPQWVVWKLEQRDGKETKVPYAPRVDMGIRASSTDLKTWGTFDEALAAYKATESRYGGIGFVFSSGDPYAGIDLDNCRNPETAEISAWAKKIIARVQEGYIEASPSGTGVHII